MSITVPNASADAASDGGSASDVCKTPGSATRTALENGTTTSDGRGVANENRSMDPICAEKPWVGLLVSVPLLLVAVGASVAGVVLAWSDSSNRLAPAALIVAAFFLVAACAAPFVASSAGRAYRREEEECRKDCEVLRKALEGISDRTIGGMADANFRQIRRFIVIAQRQARTSFYASLASASCVLLILTAGSAATVGLDAQDAKILAGSLTVIASALSAFLTASFVHYYSMATKQMSFYYGQPLVHCYLLHAAWLVSESQDLPKDSHAQWEQIIKTTLQAAHDAQHHLLELDGERSRPAA
jgi:hypothetical protein